MKDRRNVPINKDLENRGISGREFLHVLANQLKTNADNDFWDLIVDYARNLPVADAELIELGKSITREIIAELSVCKPRILVVGVGGTVAEVINHMAQKGRSDVRFAFVGSDFSDVSHSLADEIIWLYGITNTIVEAREELTSLVQGVDVVLIAASAIGSTGIEVASAIAEIAKEKDILTMAVFAESKLSINGEHNLCEKFRQLVRRVDSFLMVKSAGTMRELDDLAQLDGQAKRIIVTLLQVIGTITDVVARPNIINLDLNSIKQALKCTGLGFAGIGSADGEERAGKAARAAIMNSNDRLIIKGAKAIIFHISGGRDMTIHEVKEAADVITSYVDNDKAKFFWSLAIDESRDQDDIKVSLIAGGLSSYHFRQLRDIAIEMSAGDGEEPTFMRVDQFWEREASVNASNNSGPKRNVTGRV